MGKKNSSSALAHLDPIKPESDEIRVVIETPKGSANKYKLDEDLGLFILSGVLPAGAAFPFDFGFIPSTLAEDGDPLDVLVLMDEPAFPGCVIDIRPIGVIKARQSDAEESTRNDRLIGVAAKSRTHRDVRSIDDLSVALVEEIEHFFISYNQVKDRVFEPLGRRGPEHARELIDAGIRCAAKGSGTSAKKSGSSTKQSKKAGKKNKPGANKS